MKKILLIGGAGMSGTHLASVFAQAGYSVCIPTRRRDKVTPLSVLPNVRMVSADVNQPEVLAGLMQGVDIVINSTGVLHGSYQATGFSRRFAAVHVELPRKIVAAMKQAGVSRLLHVSALGASEAGVSGYIRSKAAGEAVVLDPQNGLNVTVFRPSLMIGASSGWVVEMGKLLSLTPVLPIFAGKVRCQPVAAEDVAHAMLMSVNNRETFGHTYELGGQERYAIVDLLSEMARIMRRKVCFPNLPFALLRILAPFVALLPNPPFSPDLLRTARCDNVLSGKDNLPGFVPQSIASVLPNLLAPANRRTRFNAWRQKRENTHNADI